MWRQGQKEEQNMTMKSMTPIILNLCKRICVKQPFITAIKHLSAEKLNDAQTNIDAVDSRAQLQFVGDKIFSYH